MPIEVAEGGVLVEEVVIHVELDAVLAFDAPLQIIETFVKEPEMDQRFLDGIVLGQLPPDSRVSTNHVAIFITRFGLFL